MYPAPPVTYQSLISEAQLTANRENAQHSTGPKTEEGKNRSKINATRHGLTGQFHAMSREDKAAFDIHCNSLMADFQPATYREKTLAISIAEGTWRLSRSRAIENNIFAIGMSTAIGDATTGDSPEVHTAACQARVWLADSTKLALLTLYESRIRRTVEKDQKEFAELQATRHAARNIALEQAKLLARLAIMESREFKITEDEYQNGFEFSAVEITRTVRREIRLEKAARLINQAAKPLHMPQAA